MEEKKERIGTTNKTAFTRMPQDLFNSLLITNLSKRELYVCLLIIRLTHGCHNDWANLIQADLKIVGIDSNHAKEILSTLVNKKIVLQNSKTHKFKLNNQYFVNENRGGYDKIQSLSKLIGKNLPKLNTRNGNINIPFMGTNELPNKEVNTSQNGSNATYPKREVPASNNNGFISPKDILKDRLRDITDRQIIGNENLIRREVPCE